MDEGTKAENSYREGAKVARKSTALKDSNSKAMLSLRTLRLGGDSFTSFKIKSAVICVIADNRLSIMSALTKIVRNNV